MSNTDKYFSLFKIIGMSASNNFTLSCNRRNGLTAWITGPFVILYDVKRDKQEILKNKNNKTFNCLTFSDDGSYLACGEGDSKNCEVILYEMNFENISESKIKHSYKAHKFGVDKLRYFKNDKFLMSIGDRDDKGMLIVNPSNGEIIFNAKFNRPIFTFDICDNFLILGGNQFLKVWSFEEVENKKLVIIKNNVDLAKLKDKIFTAGVIYPGTNSNSTSEKRVLLLTKDGHLAELKYNTRQISRWVHLKTEKGISLCVYDQMLVCGCGDGIIRIFKIDTLEHFNTLHRPPPLGGANIDSNIKKINISSQEDKFADVITLAYNSFYSKLISIYSDKTFFVWDLKRSEKIYVDCYNSFHSGSINSMDVQVTSDDILSIATCSDDKTVKLWNLKLEDFGIENSHSNRKISHIAYSKIIKRIFYFSKSFSQFKFNIDNYTKLGEDKIGSNYTNDYDEIEITSIKFSPDEKYLACGDNIGYLHIFNLSTFEKINYVSAHNSQISCIDFIKTNSGYLIATGSLDNLINVIDVSMGMDKDFEKDDQRSVLNDHQAPVTNVIFCIDKIGKIKLISCSSDRSINFYRVESANCIQLVQKFQENEMSTYCLALDPMKKKIIAGHNGKVTIWSTKSCMIKTIYQVKRGDTPLDNFRMAVDSCGSIFATSNNDKYIRIRSIADGQLIAKIPIAESISSLCFSIKNSFLIASSVEGYIYFFKINMELFPVPKTKPISDKKKNENKLRLVAKLMQEDSNLKNNEKVQALIKKMQNSEDLQMEDFQMIDSYSVDLITRKNRDVKPEENEMKNNLDEVQFTNQIDLLNNNIKIEKENPIKHSNSNINSKEIIEIKEEKANTEEDEEENKNEGNNLNDPNARLLNRSSIFEKNIKELSTAEILKKSSILNPYRVSLADTHQKKKGLNVNLNISEGKNEIHIPKYQFIENVFKKANVDLDEASKDKMKTENTGKSISVKKDDVNQIYVSNIKHAKSDEEFNLNIKNNNFIKNIETPKLSQQHSTNTNSSDSTRVLLSHNSKKNLREKQNSLSNNDEVLKLQQIVSDTTNKIDDLDNKFNSSSELKKNNNQKKENKEEDFDYFSNDERLSNIKGVDINHIQRANNIFKKNLIDNASNDNNAQEKQSEENLFNNKFSNIQDRNNHKKGLSEIIEDFEDLSESNKIVDITTNLDVSDTMVNKDKFNLADINTNSTYNVSQQSQFITETFFNETGMLNTNTNITQMTHGPSTGFTQILDNSNISDLLCTNTDKNKLISNEKSNFNNISNIPKNRPMDCIREKFSFTINHDNSNNINRFEKQIESFEHSIDKLDSSKILNIYR